MRWDHWLEMVVPGARILQDEFPRLFVDYRRDCRAEGPPHGAAVVRASPPSLPLSFIPILLFVCA